VSKNKNKRQSIITSATDKKATTVDLEVPPEKKIIVLL
jgi:hypothetical protein